MPKTKYDLLEELAEGIKENPRYQSLKPFLENPPMQPGGFGGMAGLTKKAAGGTVIRQFFEDFPTRVRYGGQHPYANLKDELAELLRVIAATPKKAIQHIKEFELIPGSRAGGSYHPEALRVFPSEASTSPMASSWAHEAGHGASIPMLGKLLKRGGYKPTPKNPTEELVDIITGAAGYPENIRMGLSGYHSYKPEMEGVAEYLGAAILKKAGYLPHYEFGHGAEQGRVFFELVKMPSKNPYMNVYRYLQKIVR